MEQPHVFVALFQRYAVHLVEADTTAGLTLQRVDEFRTGLTQGAFVIGKRHDPMAFRHGEQHRLTLLEHDDRPRSACRLRTTRAISLLGFRRLKFRPCDCRARKACGIGHLKRHTGLAVPLVFTAQRVHGIVTGELRRTEAIYEQAPHQRAVLFHTFQNGIQP